MKLLNDWEGGTATDAFKDFAGTRWSALPLEEKPEFKGFEILLASYAYENYSGDAFVLARKDGKLYEVNGGHCSCYGLEGQWAPEETTIAALRHRLDEGRLGAVDGWRGDVFAAELRAVLDELEAAPGVNSDGGKRR
jgi:hypothetical protein